MFTILQLINILHLKSFEIITYNKWGCFSEIDFKSIPTCIFQLNIDFDAKNVPEIKFIEKGIHTKETKLYVAQNVVENVKFFSLH